MTIEIFLGYVTGLRFLGYDLDFQELLSTAVFIHVLDAVVCRVFAGRNGSSKNLWTLYGLVCGGWAVLSIILVPVFGNALSRLMPTASNRPGTNARPDRLSHTAASRL